MSQEPRRRAAPSATYRLQFTADFPLGRGAELAGYLADLGVTHAYASPLLRSAEGSTHGYDTVDHAHIDEARGGRAGLDRLVEALLQHETLDEADAYAAAGIDLPHSSRMQASIGQSVSREQLQPGDLVAFYSPISHIGIYIGNGQMVHAPTSGDVVKVASIDSMGGYAWARRIAA